MKKMIEITFDDSFSGMLKMEHRFLPELIGEVQRINLQLQWGDLSLGVLSKEYEEHIYKEMNSEWLRADRPDKRRRAKLEDQIRTLKDRLASGDKIRIWFYENVRDLSVLLYLASEFKGIEGEISYINLSDLCENDDKFIMSFNDECLKFERKLTNKEKNRMASSWGRLSSQHYMLRAIEDGKLIGVSENYYDEFIRSCIPQDSAFTAVNAIRNCWDNMTMQSDCGIFEWRLSKILKSPEYMVVGERNGEEPSDKLWRLIFKRV